MENHEDYDAIIVGSGMGGMSTGAMLAKDGYKVLILEAAHAPGGCSSSYYRKGYVFETGATTLMGFDENQPLWKLEQETGIKIPRKEIEPPMAVWLNGKRITRYKNPETWIQEAGRTFGNAPAQRAFWQEALKVSELVWELSLKNRLFPPQNIREWIHLITQNSPFDMWVLKYVLQSVDEVMQRFGTDTPQFRKFTDEQLMITAQATAADTPFLFGAAALTYTNHSNYYVPGGMLEMVNAIRLYIQKQGGELHTKEGVALITKKDDEGLFSVHTKKKKRYRAPIVISNIPVWNMPDITSGEMNNYFRKEASGFTEAWGAITIGIGMKDTFEEAMPLHHQFHLSETEWEGVPHVHSGSLFVSMSEQGDTLRTKKGKRTLNISMHTRPDYWFSLQDHYEQAKQQVEAFVVQVLEKRMPGFERTLIEVIHTATPVTWQNWVYRKKGRVGGIPQNMARSLLGYSSHKTPFKGLYLVGDTTYPGQGIPGVTLSGINVYSRITNNY